MRRLVLLFGVVIIVCVLLLFQNFLSESDTSNSILQKNAFSSDRKPYRRPPEREKIPLTHSENTPSHSQSPTNEGVPTKGTIKGVVVDEDGNPLQIVDISVFGDEGQDGVKEEFRGNRFRISGLEIGREYELDILPRGGWSEERFKVVLDKESVEMKAVFKKDDICEGVVTTLDGTPIEGVTIEWYRRGLRDVITQTDKDGRFTIFHLCTGGRLEFRKAGDHLYAWGNHPFFSHYDIPYPRCYKRYELPHRSFVKVFVSPTAATLKINITIDNKLYKGSLYITGEGVHRDFSSGGDPFPFRWNYSENGVFEFKHLMPARLNLFAFVEGYFCKPLTVDLSDGDGEANVAFSKNEGSIVEGKVLDSEGKPASKRAVYFRLLNSGSPYSVAFVRVQKDGSYRIHSLPPGEYIVTVGHIDDIAMADDSYEPVRVVITENGTVEHIDFLHK